MYYRLNDDIYIVKGAKYGCIYDLMHNALYRINEELYELIQSVLKNEDVGDEGSDIIQSLVEQEILIPQVHKNERVIDIEEKYSYDRSISFAWIELTNSCNLRCIHCYNEHAEIMKQYLSIAEFKYIVDELISIGVKCIQLIGGEPYVLSKDILVEMMDYLSPRVTSFEIFTNNTINTNSDLELLRKRYSNINIATSLHSYICDEHEKITQVKGSFAKTLANIRYAKKIGLPIRYVGTLIAGLEIGEELSDIGKPSRRDYIRLAGNANLKLYDRKLLEERVINEESMHFKDLKTRVDYIYNDSCFATHLYIGSDMNVYPCPMERRVNHGNLNGVKLADLLDQRILNMSKNEIVGCKDCEYKYICLDCRPDSLNGGYKDKPWYCLYDPYSGKWQDFEDFSTEIKQIQDNIDESDGDIKVRCSC